ncbi:MAG: outer membrane lipoprotein carrier protein LolA [Spirochaetes bacterium]|nr:outer membrane lipoprotein carrier protein LolA [Spirochaetota bacterium]
MKKLGIIIMLIALACPALLFSLTGEEAVEKFQGRMYGVKKLTGVISWTSLEGQTYSGSFKYMAPGKIYVKFTAPSEKILVSNGATLWIFTPSRSVCAMQELLKGTASGGVAAFVRGYDGIATEGDTGYTIKLKNDTKQYPEIILSVDLTFMLKGAIFKRDDGRIMSFSLSDTSVDADVDPSLFEFKVPKGVQVVRNPINVR